MNDSQLKDILTRYKRIAVLGLSPISSRPSFAVTRYMISAGYEIYGVRPGAPGEILGRLCVEHLKDLKAPVDILNVFRRSEAIPELVTEIEAWLPTLKERPKVLWLQEGITHPEAEERARGLGLTVVSDRCILKDHLKL